jgi:hypothetical protein
MKKLVSNFTMIALTLAIFIQPLALTARANTNSPSSSPTEESAHVSANAPAAVAYPNAKMKLRKFDMIRA